MSISAFELFQDKFILIVEPMTTTRTKLAKAFSTLGLHVLAAESAKAALEMIDSFRMPALTITELVLPDMTGVQLATLLTESYPCPIIFTTSNPDPAQIAKLLDSVAEDVVCKPFDAREVAARASRILVRQQWPSQLPKATPINHQQLANQRQLHKQPISRQ